MDQLPNLPWQNFGLAGLMLAACLMFIWRITGAYREDMAKARSDFQTEMQTQRNNDSAERKEDRETFTETLSAIQEKGDQRHEEVIAQVREAKHAMGNYHQDILLRTGLKTMLPKNNEG